jgi:hypothetical protein
MTKIEVGRRYRFYLSEEVYAYDKYDRALNNKIDNRTIWLRFYEKEDKTQFLKKHESYIPSCRTVIGTVGLIDRYPYYDIIVLNRNLEFIID